MLFVLTMFAYGEGGRLKTIFFTDREVSEWQRTDATKKWYGIVISDNSYINYGVSIYGESTIDGKRYAKVYVAESDWECLLPPSDKAGNFLMRQEGDKVLMRNDDGTERVIIDYGLEIGDTFDMGSDGIYTVVEKGYQEGIVDERPKYGNEIPKMLKLRNDNGQEDIWVEGIGSLTFGIIPWSVLSTCDFMTIKEKPELMAILLAGNENMEIWETYNVWGGELIVIEHNDDLLKMKEISKQGFSDDLPEFKERGYFIDYSFNNSTFEIRGIHDFSTSRHAFWQMVKVGYNKYHCTYYKYGGLTDDEGRKYFTVNFPGFAEGEYSFGVLWEDEYITINNNPAGIDNINASQHSPISYDITGKRYNGIPKSVIISNGKKYIGK